MAKPKLLCFDDAHYATPFLDIFEVNRVPYPDSLQAIREALNKSDVILFTGGGDVDPALYNEPNGKYTHPDKGRSKYEFVIGQLAIQAKKPILGICRGAQISCVFAGGKLIQHVTAHGQDHYIVDADGDKDYYLMTSMHHQMMHPKDTEHQLIAYSQGLSNDYLDGYDKSMKELVDADKEPEIVFFNKIQALGIQGHPEMLSKVNKEEVKTLEWCKTLARQYLLGA